MANERNQKRSAELGALIIVAITAAAFAIFFVPDLFRMAVPSMEVVVLMPSAGALERNSPVWIAGRSVGKVTRVWLRPAAADSNARVAVYADVPRKYAQELRQDSRARITTARLIGEPALDLLPGSLDAPLLSDHDTIRMRPLGSLEAVLDKTIKLTRDFDKLIVDMSNVKRPAERRAREMARLNANLGAVGRQFRELTNALANSPMNTLSDARFRTLLDHLNTNSRNLRTALRQASERARAAHSQAQPSLDRLQARADTISRMLGRLQASLQSTGGGLIVRAQRDSAIVKALHETQVQLDSLMAETKRNPLRFWF